jgi:hypothetical protein
MGYIRFVIPRRNGDSHRHAGVFMAALRHWARDDVEASLRDHLAWLLDWFSEHLDVPCIDEPRAIFWFRGCGNPCTRRVWELTLVLRELGEQPRLLKARRPGYVVYEDRHQVAAVPFRETPC